MRLRAGDHSSGRRFFVGILTDFIKKLCRPGGKGPAVWACWHVLSKAQKLDTAARGMRWMSDLLEYLSDVLHCVYLSDLHYVIVSPEQADALLSLPDEKFSLSEYQHALDYLLGSKQPDLPDLPTARRALVEALERRK